MSQKDFDNYLNLLQSGSYSAKDVVSFLKIVRNGCFRCPPVVFSYGRELLAKQFWSVSSNEVWDIVEQVFYAALDCGKFEAADEYLSWMDKQFPGSTRVMRLRGVSLEARGEMRKAEKIYFALSGKDPGDTLTLKRRIAIASGLGKRDVGIQLLNEYLTVFMGDQEAWAELASLYLKENMYENAAFCYEELILVEPNNYHYYVKYAEILYTLRGLENYLQALKYYSYSLELQKENNLPALYGLIMTVNTISSFKQSALPKEATEAFELVKGDIMTLYNNNNKPLQNIVSSALHQLTPRSLKNTTSSASTDSTTSGMATPLLGTASQQGGATTTHKTSQKIQKNDKKGKKKAKK